MSAEFVRYPHTPHLAWLGDGAPRDDKVLAPAEAHALLASTVVVEEKLDGANLGLSLDPDDGIQAQSRGRYLARPFMGQFSRLAGWLAEHEAALVPALAGGRIAFGEWCAARHTLAYDHLPDWWLAFDLYDRGRGEFVSTAERNAWAARAGVETVPQLLRGHTTRQALERLLREGRSRYRAGPIEGVVLREDAGDRGGRRAKLVRAEFVQAIGEHWSGRRIEWNRVADHERAARL